MLGVPWWQPAAAQAVDAAEPAFCYRFERWLLLTDTRLDTTASWTFDLVATMAELTNQSQSALAEVSATTLSNWPTERVLDLREATAEAHQLAHMKQTLWQQISHALHA